MRWYIILSQVLVVLLLRPVHGLANVTGEQDEIEMFKSDCIDARRRPVLNVRNDSLNDVGFSDFMRMHGMVQGPMIILNIKRLKELSKASQKFFVVHECGHHVLGHLYARVSGVEVEQEADCYALRTLIHRGDFTLQDIVDVQSDMRKFGRASAHHKDGETRAKNLTNCLVP